MLELSPERRRRGVPRRPRRRRRARRGERDHAALRAALHAPPPRRAAAARRDARPARRARRPQRPLRVLGVPLHAHRAHAHVPPQRRRRRARRPRGAAGCRRTWSRTGCSSSSAAPAARRRAPFRGSTGSSPRAMSASRGRGLLPQRVRDAAARAVQRDGVRHSARARARGGRARRWTRSSAARLPIAFPLEVRFAAGDDALLSTAHDRETCYVAVHQYRGMEFETCFRAIEAIMDVLRRPPALGQAPLPDRRDARRALSGLGGVPGRARAARSRRRVHERLRTPRARGSTRATSIGNIRRCEASSQGAADRRGGVVRAPCGGRCRHDPRQRVMGQARSRRRPPRLGRAGPRGDRDLERHPGLRRSRSPRRRTAPTRRSSSTCAHPRRGASPSAYACSTRTATGR